MEKKQTPTLGIVAIVLGCISISLICFAEMGVIVVLATIIFAGISIYKKEKPVSYAVCALILAGISLILIFSVILFMNTVIDPWLNTLRSHWW